MTRLGELATRDGVTGTPTFFLNGQKIDDPSIMTYDGMAAALDAAIAARG
jgi:protein-disulfide isomerase